jgi:hypothetical protein
VKTVPNYTWEKTFQLEKQVIKDIIKNTLEMLDSIPPGTTTGHPVADIGLIIYSGARGLWHAITGQ